MRWSGVVVLACACGSDPHRETLESEHIVLTFPDEAPVCAGTLPYLERSAQAQAALLGIELGTIEYILWSHADWSSSPCPQAAGCVFEHRIHTPYPDLTHELVHAMRLQQSIKLIEEGLAVALGDDEERQFVTRYDPPLAEQLEVAALPFADYEEAGDFVSYLIARADPDRVAALADALPADLPAGERAAAFAAAYGQTIEEVVAGRWQSGWRFEGGDLQVPECASDPVGGDAAGFTLAIDCDDGGIGYAVDTSPYVTPYVRRNATVEIAADGMYRLDVVHSDVAGAFAMQSCPLDGDPTLPYEAFRIGGLSQPTTVLAYLRAGRYALTGLAKWPGSARVDVGVALATPTSCAAPLTTIPDRWILVPHPSAPVELALLPDTDRRLTLDRIRDADLEVCPACGTCTPLAEGDELALAAGQTALVRVTTTTTGATASLRL
jgi:hypothetical protein